MRNHSFSLGFNMDKKSVLEIVILTIVIISVWMAMFLPVVLYFLVRLQLATAATVHSCMAAIHMTMVMIPTIAIIIYSPQPLAGEEGADHEGKSATVAWKVGMIVQDSV